MNNPGMRAAASTNELPILTKEQVRKYCPLAFAEAPTNKVSDRYVLANTATVIDDMEKLGWYPVQASQRKRRADASGRFSYHMVVFQNPDVKIVRKDDDGNEVVDSYPRVILTNSHDGLACFRFRVGIYRLVCSNGLVIPTSEMADVRVRHINYTFDALRGIVCKAVEAVNANIGVINKMKEVQLTDEQAKSMAKEMLAIREEKDVNELVVDDETIDNMLTPARKADEGKDLWSVFNVLQEKVIRGGFFRSSIRKKDNKLRWRKVRKVTSFIKDLDFNERMFETALGYIPKVVDEEELVPVEA